jgi:hypothetical protein
VNPTESKRVPTPDRHGRQIDAGIVIFLIIAWLALLTGPLLRQRPVAADTFRDAATAAHMLSGRWSDDPALRGLPYWYAPLGTAICSLASRITGLAPLDLYALSPLAVNVWILPLLYLLIRRSADRLTAITAVLLLVFGTRWWPENIALPIPSVQGIVLLLATLIAWTAAINRAPGHAVLVGILLAICTWHHLICGIVGAAALAGHTLIAGCQRSADRAAPRLLLPSSIAAAVSGLAVGPLAWHLIRLQRNNPVPSSWNSPLMFDVHYWLPLGVPWLGPLAVVGTVWLWRTRRRATGWVLGYAACGLLGQVPAVVNRLWTTSWPTLVPHQFQWHAQIAIALLAAAGLVRLVRLATESLRPNAVAWAWGLAMVLVLAGAFPGVGQRFETNWIPTDLPPPQAEAVEWLRDHAGIYDVICCDPQTAYWTIAPRTGCKFVTFPAGHANIAARMGDRDRDYQVLMSTTDRSCFSQLVDKHAVQYIWIDAQHRDRIPWLTRSGGFNAIFTTRDGTITILANGPQPP